MLCEIVKAVTVFTSFQPPPRDDEQRQHEQQMVDAREDVLDAEHDVGAGDLQRARRGLDDEATERTA